MKVKKSLTAKQLAAVSQQLAAKTQPVKTVREQLNNILGGDYSAGIKHLADIIEENDSRDVNMTYVTIKKSIRVVKLLRQAAKLNDQIQATIV